MLSFLSVITFVIPTANRSGKKMKLRHFCFIFLQHDFLNIFKDRVKAVRAPDSQNILESGLVIVGRTRKQHCFKFSYIYPDG